VLHLDVCRLWAGPDFRHNRFNGTFDVPHASKIMVWLKGDVNEQDENIIFSKMINSREEGFSYDFNTF